MANTPIELYGNAYRLQYHENKLPEAIKIYEAIIREFPESNECGYAVIQLQKLKANDITEALKKSSIGVHPVLVASLVSSLFALLVALAGILFLVHQLRIEHYRVTLAVVALSKMSHGNHEGALKVIEELKKISPRDVLPIELSSSIDRKREFGQTAANSSPSVSPPSRSADTAGPLQDQINKASFVKGAGLPAVKKPRPPRRTRAPISPKQSSGKKENGLFVVDPDSLSFF